MFVGARDMILFHAYETIAEGLEDCGAEAVELRLMPDMTLPRPDAPRTEPFNVAEVGEDAVADAYKAAGVRVGAILLPTDLNAEDQQAQIDWCVRAVRLAEALGADAVRIDSAMTGQLELPWMQRVKIFSDAVCRILEATADSSVPLGIENHGAQGNDPAWMGAILARVDSPRLGLTLDPGNFYWAGHPLQRVHEIVQTFAPHTVHTHCKNIRYPDELKNCQRERGFKYGEYVCSLRDGDVDYRRVIPAAISAGYRGGWYVEDESLGKLQGQARRQRLRDDCAYLAEIIREAANQANASS